MSLIPVGKFPRQPGKLRVAFCRALRRLPPGLVVDFRRPFWKGARNRGNEPRPWALRQRSESPSHPVPRSRPPFSSPVSEVLENIVGGHFGRMARRRTPDLAHSVDEWRLPGTHATKHGRPPRLFVVHEDPPGVAPEKPYRPHFRETRPISNTHHPWLALLAAECQFCDGSENDSTEK